MKISVLLSLLVGSFTAFAYPGDLVSITHLNDETSANVTFARQKFCPAEAGISKAYGFKRYKLTYKTSGLNGQEVETSGLLIVPDANGFMPMFVYQHGTVFARIELPSGNPQYAEGDAMGYCFASLGYVSVLSDYLGYGDATGVHPYLHANSEAWVARDMLRAARFAALKLRVGLNIQLFIAGYSQGGHAAMSLLRFLEQDPYHEFLVTAAAPMAGPYHISETISQVVSMPAAHSAPEGAFIVMGLNPIYGFYKDLSEVIQPAYVPLVSTLFDGTHNWGDVQAKLSMALGDLFQPAFLQSVVQDPNSPLLQALRKNDVYQWRPRTPLHLYHGGGDHEVPFANSQEAYDYMKAAGANVQLINLGANVDHPAGFPLAIGQAALWFESLR